MLTILIAMLAILLVCGLVVTYVAFPHRGEQVPGAPWVGDTMTRAGDAFSLMDDRVDADVER